MKKLWVGICIIALAASASAFATTAQVSSSGTGSVSATPDIAVVQGRVTIIDETPEAAVKSVQKKLDSVVRYVLGQGVDPVDLQAAQVLVNPQWHYPRNAPREITGYQAYASFSAKLRDIALLSKVYSGLVKAGATELSPTTFEFSQREELELEAISKAVVFAKRKAEAGLKPLKQSVGDVIQMNVDTHWQQPPMLKASRASMMSDASVESTPQLNIGEQTIQATVSVTFEID